VPLVHALYITAGEPKMNYTYILLCSDGTLYTGWTNNMEKRLRDHNSGKGAKYTKGRIPVELVYYETFPTKAEAMRREWEIKQLGRKEKQQLIKQLHF
jgi:putative endonuclease